MNQNSTTESTTTVETGALFSRIPSTKSNIHFANNIVESEEINYFYV